MKEKLLKNSPVVLLVLITLLFGKLQVNKHLSSENDICFNICSDARGYYAWLPAIFIHHDLNFGFFDEIEVQGATCGGTLGGCLQDYRYAFDGGVCNKYYPGAAFMMLPFFVVSHAGTLLFTSDPANGYSPLYFKLIGFAGIFYYLIGMLLFLKILDKLGLNLMQKILSIIFMSFGTNIIYYAVDKPTYSHIYSFVLITLFILYALRLKETFNYKNVCILSFILGFIFVTRPVNISVVLILPFMFWGNITHIINEIIRKPLYLLCLASGLIMPIILFLLYKISTGNYFLYSYDKEGFDFLKPHFLEFLFDYDNGVFLYMPILLLPILFAHLWVKNENFLLGLGLLFTLLITMYIHSSWWCWSYAFSFGARTMLDFMALFGIMLALLLKQNNIKRYYYLLPLCILCCGLTMLLYHQKHNGFLNIYPITDYWAAIYDALGIK